MLDYSETVTVDSVMYPLSDYPSAYVQKITSYLGGDPVCHLEHYGFTPDTCPLDVIPLHDGLRLPGGQPDARRWFHLGETTDRIDLDHDGQPIIERASVDGVDATRIAEAWLWCDVHAQGRFELRFEETNEDWSYHDVFLAFSDDEIEARFLKAFEWAERA